MQRLKTLIMSNFKKTMGMQRKLLTMALQWIDIIENPNTDPKDFETAVLELGKTMESLIEFNLNIADL